MILRSNGALQPKEASLRPIVALLLLVILRSNGALQPKNDSSSEDDIDTHNRSVRQVLIDFLAVEEAYCQVFNYNHIGEMAEHMQQMAATDYTPSNDADQRVAEISGTAICNRVEGQGSHESNTSQVAVRTTVPRKEA